MIHSFLGNYNLIKYIIISSIFVSYILLSLLIFVHFME